MRTTSNRAFAFLAYLSLAFMCYSMGKGRWWAVLVFFVAALLCYGVVIFTAEDE